MNIHKFNLSMLVAFAGLVAGSGTVRADAVNIAQDPLFLLPPVQPALIMAVDDSGSMDAEILVDANDGAMWWNNGFTSGGKLNFNLSNANLPKYFYLMPNGTGTDGRSLSDNSGHFAVPPLPQFAFARSPEFNAIYFNPAVDYPPFPSSGSATFEDADPTAAKADPVVGNQPPWDLAQPVPRDDNNWTFRFQDGMVIPDDITIKHASSNTCPAVLEADQDFSNWTAVNGSIEINQDNCNVAVKYFPATFWLPAFDSEGNSITPDGFNGTPISGGEAPDGSPMLGYEIKPDNFTNYDVMIQRFANWFQYYRKRVHLTRAAVGRSFSEVEFLRVGFFRINNRTNVSMLDLVESADRETFFDWQYDLQGNGGTPNKRAVDHIGDQFDSQSGSNAPILEACQRNFGMLVTDGFYSDVGHGNVGNTDGGAGSPLAGTVLADDLSDTLADIAYSYYNTHLRAGDIDGGQVPTPSACDQANPSLDLDCQEDPHMNLFSVTLGAKGLIFGRDDDIVDDPFNDPTPTWPDSIPSRHPSTIDDLWHATLNTRGGMFTATRPDELVEALTNVLRDIASRIQPVGLSASASRIDEGSLFFVADLDSSTWNGNLSAFDAQTEAEEWSAEDELGNHADRNILTTVGGSARNFNTGNTDLKDSMFGAGSTLSDAEKNDIINYLRGDRSNEEQKPGGTLRDRDGAIGDIANSRPTFSGPRNEGWGRLDTTYLDYLDDKLARDPTVLVGANDGMLHAFNATASGGQEEFAFVPSMVHEKLPSLADPDYTHQFFVDGQVTVADAKLGTWKTVAVGGLGGGGRGIYALDITNAGSFGQSDVLWELDASDDGDIGHVYDEPIVTRLGDGDWVVIFANGFNSDDDQAHLFVVNLADGSIRNKIALGNAGANGLSSTAAFLDPQTRLFTRRVYAGDLEGNMWRVDFTDGGSPTDPFGNKPLVNVGRPIVSPPTLAPNPSGGLMVFFGTGKLIEVKDRTGEPSAFDRMYAIRDRNSTFNNLKGLGEATISLNGGQRVVNKADDVEDGWFIDLGVNNNITGERVLARPQVVFGQLIFSTFEPLEDVCAPGGTRRIYALDAVSGRGLLDQLCENCGVIEVGEGAPVDPAIILRPPTSPDDPDDPADVVGDPGDVDIPDVDSVGSVAGWCSESVMLVAGEGFVSLGTVCDGRQVWRQAR